VGFASTNLAKRCLSTELRVFQNHATAVLDKENKGVYLEPYVKENNDFSFILEQLDAMIERSWAVSSLMIDRLVDNSQNYEELNFLEYYLYRFRHSPSGHFLRPWTVLNLFDKCLSLDQEIYSEKLKELLFRMLENRTQYGLFPHGSSYNYLFEKLAETENLNENPQVYENGVRHSDYSVKLVRNAFYAEKFEDPVTAILSTEIVLSYLQEHLKDGENKIDDIEDILLRDFGGVLVAAMTLHKNDSSIFSEEIHALGHSLLNRLEKKFLENNEFRKMYQKPFAPLSQVPKYTEEKTPDTQNDSNLLNSAVKSFAKIDKNSTEIINKQHKSDLEDFKHWSSLKSHLSEREAKIVDTRTNKYYYSKIHEAMDTEARVSAITKRGLWNLATEAERSAAGRAVGIESDSENIFKEYTDGETRYTEISAFAIHDLDLEQTIAEPVRQFESSDGNVEMFAGFTFDAQSVTHRWVGNRPLALAHYAMRSLDDASLKKLLEKSDVKEGIYNFG